jgi:Glycosyl hydrolase family 65, N-terminal domain
MGTLLRRLAWEDAQGRRTRMVQRRLVSMKDEHLAGLETTFVAENWSGTLEVRSGLDGRVVNARVKRYRDLNGRHLAVLDQAEVNNDTVDLQVETTQSHVRVALAARTRLLRDGQTVEAGRRLVAEPGFVAHKLAVLAGAGRPATVEKVVALSTSRDRAISESRADAHLTVAGAQDFAGLLARHELSGVVSAWVLARYEPEEAPGSSACEPWRATSPTSRAAPPPKASTSAPGRHGRHRPPLPHRHASPRPGAPVRPGPAPRGQAAQVQRRLPRPPDRRHPGRGPHPSQLPPQ